MQLPWKQSARNGGGHGPARNLLVSTPGEVLADGTIIELIRDRAGARQPSLLIWDGTSACVTQRFEHNSIVYVPASFDPSIVRAMRFPTRIASYGSTRELFDQVCRLLTRFNGLSGELAAQLTYFLFSSWLADRVPVAPFLSIVAPSTAPSGTLMQLLALLCRHALFVGDVRPSGLRALPMELRPTLLLDAVELSGSLQRLLRASSTQGIYIPSGGRALDLYCAKVISTQGPLRDPSLVGRMLQVVLAPTRRQLPVLDWKTTEQIADEFQAKLLMYRLTAYREVCAPSIYLGGLAAPTQDLARTLGACIVGDAGLQSGVVPLLTQQDEELRFERAASLESVILEALLFCCHDGDRSTVRVAEVAEITNTILVGRGEKVQVSPESWGGS